MSFYTVHALFLMMAQGLETEIGQSKMLVWPTTERPMIFAVRLLDREVIDARQPMPHQAVVIKLPILIAVRAIPVPGIIMPFVGKTRRDAIPVEGPKLFDQPIIEFLRPFAAKKRDDFMSAVYEFRAVSPARIDRVGLSHFFRVARIPSVLCQADLLNGSRTREWRKRR